MLLDLQVTVLQTRLPNPVRISRKGLHSLNAGAQQAGEAGLVGEAGGRWARPGDHKSGRERSGPETENELAN